MLNKKYFNQTVVIALLLIQQFVDCNKSCMMCKDLRPILEDYNLITNPCRVHNRLQFYPLSNTSVTVGQVT